MAVNVRRGRKGVDCCRSCGSNFSNAEDEARLFAAFKGGGIEFVKSPWWDRKAKPQRSWFVGSDWALSYDEVA